MINFLSLLSSTSSALVLTKSYKEDLPNDIQATLDSVVHWSTRLHYQYPIWVEFTAVLRASLLWTVIGPQLLTCYWWESAGRINQLCNPTCQIGMSMTPILSSYSGSK
ncbi:hypothetical protein F4782DRAFT_353628 [Xylaria castorea]|nr:hypothetical protein F4782DRAFT_353628 [Xylaria castorea]